MCHFKILVIALGIDINLYIQENACYTKNYKLKKKVIKFKITSQCERDIKLN